MMAHDANSHAEESRPEVMPNVEALMSVLPETTDLLTFIRCLKMTYSPSSHSSPLLTLPLTIPTPDLLLSWLADLKRKNIGMNVSTLNLSTEKRLPEGLETLFAETIHFIGSSRHAITSTPICLQSRKFQDRILKNDVSVSCSSRDSGMESFSSPSTSSMKETSCPEISTSSHTFSIDHILNTAVKYAKQDSSKLKVYSCQYCHKEYESRSSTRLHEAIHTKPHQCSQCGRRFSRSWLVTIHKRTHTGEKPYTCPFCSRRFADRSNMRAHIRRKHSELTSLSSSFSEVCLSEPPTRLKIPNLEPLR